MAFSPWPAFPIYLINRRTFVSDSALLKKGYRSLRPGQGYYRQLQRQTGKLTREQKLRKPLEINEVSSSVDLNLALKALTDS